MVRHTLDIASIAVQTPLALHFERLAFGELVWRRDSSWNAWLGRLGCGRLHGIQQKCQESPFWMDEEHSVLLEDVPISPQEQFLHQQQDDGANASRLECDE